MIKFNNMQKLVPILVFLLLSCSHSSKSLENKEHELVEIEENLLGHVSSFQNSILENSRDNLKIYKRYIAPEYLSFMSENVNIDNIDTALSILYNYSGELMNELRNKGAILRNDVYGISEKIVRGDTLVYLVQNHLIAEHPIKKKRVQIIDYLLAISTDNGENWYFFQPNTAIYKDCIQNYLDNETLNKVLDFENTYVSEEIVEDMK